MCNYITSNIEHHSCSKNASFITVFSVAFYRSIRAKPYSINTLTQFVYKPLVLRQCTNTNKRSKNTFMDLYLSGITRNICTYAAVLLSLYGMPIWVLRQSRTNGTHISENLWTHETNCMLISQNFVSRILMHIKEQEFNRKAIINLHYVASIDTSDKTLLTNSQYARNTENKTIKWNTQDERENV